MDTTRNLETGPLSNTDIVHQVHEILKDACKTISSIDDFKKDNPNRDVAVCPNPILYYFVLPLIHFSSLYWQAISFSRVTSNDYTRLGIEIVTPNAPIQGILDTAHESMKVQSFPNYSSNEPTHSKVTYEAGFDKCWDTFGPYLQATVGYLLQYAGSKVCLFVSTLRFV